MTLRRSHLYNPPSSSKKACAFRLTPACWSLLLPLLWLSMWSGVVQSDECLCEYRREILLDFHRATNGSKWINGWDYTNASSPVCDWFGLICGGSPTKDIMHISMERNGLTGTLPRSLSNLWRLVYFDVGHNILVGTLPSELSNWTTLEQFLVFNNTMVGTLPDEYGAWSKLISLDVSTNNFRGTLPESYSNWTSLLHFDVGNNHFVNATLPTSYSRWGASVIDILMTNSAFNGTLPNEWSAFVNLENFYVGSNYLYGTLPIAYAAWTKLTNFSIKDNAITGVIPEEYRSWVRMMDLNVAFNQRLGGTLPPSFSVWTNMSSLALDNCSFNGTLPASYASMSKLILLSLTNNLMQGTLPVEYGNRWPLLESLFLVNNSFIGSIPDSYGNMTRLTALFVDLNRLNGTIPSSFSQCTNLSQISLSANDLEGTLPSSWSVLPLALLLLQNNSRLYGKIPSAWSSIFVGRLAFMSICYTGLCGNSADLPGIFNGFACIKTGVPAIPRGDLQLMVTEFLRSAVFESSIDCPITTVAPSTLLPTPPPSTAPPPADGTTILAQRGTSGAVVWTSVATAVLTPGGTYGAGAAVMITQRSVAATWLQQRCADASDDGEVDNSSPIVSSVLDSPTQLTIPSLGVELSAAAGAVIGNTLLVVVCGGILHVIAVKIRPLLLAEPTFIHSASLDKKHRDLNVRVGVAELLGTDTKPGSGAGVYSILLQPAMTGDIALISSATSRSAGSVVLGIVGLLLWMMPVAGWIWRLRLWRPFPWTAMSSTFFVRANKHNAPTWRRWTARFVAPHTEWTLPRHLQATYGRYEAGWMCLVTPYRSGCHAFILVEWALAIATAVIAGITGTVAASDACHAAEWGGWLLVALSVVQLMLHIVLRPTSCVLDLVVTVAVDVAGVISQVASVLGDDDVANGFIILGSTVSIAASLLIAGLRILSALWAARGRMLLLLPRRACHQPIALILPQHDQHVQRVRTTVAPLAALTKLIQTICLASGRRNVLQAKIAHRNQHPSTRNPVVSNN